MSRGGFYYDPGQSYNPLPKNQNDVAPVTRGVYHFLQSGFTTLALQSGSKSNDTQPSLGPKLDSLLQDLFPQLWVIHFDPNVAQKPGYHPSNTATIRHIQSGNYLTLENGSVMCRPGMEINGAAGTQQHFWFIAAQGLNMIVQSDAINNNMYYVGRDSTDPSKLAMTATVSAQSNNFIWETKKVSMSKYEMEYALQMLPGQLNDPRTSQYPLPNPLNTLAVDVEYLPVRREIVEKIHREDVFNNGPFQWRPEIYDCDDFGVAFKSAVSRWSYKNFNADGFSILVGILFGRNATGGHVFNWFITYDPNGDRVIKFFEPQAPPGDPDAVKNYPFNYNLVFGYY